jgi:hypothetical protein
MSDVWVRVLVVVGAIGIVGLASVFLRRPWGRGPSILETDLVPGVYLFTSGTCADCEPARDVLLEKLGPDGFQEIEWERDPDVFTKVGVDVVPCTVVVTKDGSATSFPGMPDAALWRQTKTG